MSYLFDLRHRNRQPELMDQPDLDPERFIESLVGLRRVNAICGRSAIFMPAIESLARKNGSGPLRVFDVGSGGGDVLIDLWRRAKRKGIALSITGSDINQLAVDFAQTQAEKARAEVEFIQFDANHDQFPPDMDIVTSSLFLHHLSWEEAIKFLRRAGESGSQAVLIQDLLRSRPAYWFAYWGVRIISRCDVVHTDGPRSVEGAFTIPEAQALAEEAGLSSAIVSAKPPFRFLLDWRRV